MADLTDAQFRNLRHVAEHGRPLPRNAAAYHCRKKGLSEFVWLFEDGDIATVSEKEPCEGAWLSKVVGEQLTEDGRLALQQRTAQ